MNTQLALPCHERILIGLVRSGEWTIDGEGRIWRNCFRSGLKPGGYKIIPCETRRVEEFRGGYLTCSASIAGKRFRCSAHRLVWQNLHGNIPQSYEINHENGIKTDNRPDNLSLMTSGENKSHAFRTGLRSHKGENHPRAKLSDSEVARIRAKFQAEEPSFRSLALEFGCTKQTIHKIVRNLSRRLP